MVKFNELDISEDIAGLPPLSDIVAMATVAGLAAPVMMAMLKAAYKTGKGINALRKIAKRAGVALSDKFMGVLPVWAVAMAALYYFAVYRPQHEAN